MDSRPEIIPDEVPIPVVVSEQEYHKVKTELFVLNQNCKKLEAFLVTLGYGAKAIKRILDA